MFNKFMNRLLVVLFGGIFCFVGFIMVYKAVFGKDTSNIIPERLEAKINAAPNDKEAILAVSRDIWWGIKAKENVPATVKEEKGAFALYITRAAKNLNNSASTEQLRLFDAQDIGINVWRTFYMLPSQNLKTMDVSVQTTSPKGEALVLWRLRCNREAMERTEGFSRKPYWKGYTRPDWAKETGVALTSACTTLVDNYKAIQFIIR